MKQWIKEVARGKRGSTDLSYEQALEAAAEIADGKATDAQLAAFLIGERMKMETSDELLAFVKQFSKRTIKLNLSKEIREKIIDFASPYAGRNSFYTTIPVSLLLADRGIPVFLHGSDALPPKYGTSIADILQALGIQAFAEANEIADSIKSLNIGFGLTEKLCEPLANLRKVREELHVRTIFNTVEKLLNISEAQSIMLGAFHRTAITKIAPLFQNYTFNQVYIVQGVEGSEDLPVHRNSFIYHIKHGEIESQIVNPKDYGVAVEEDSFVKKITLEEQAEFTEAILSGSNAKELDYMRNQVLFNTGIRYYLFGYEKTIEAGIEFARKQLEGQKGLAKLKEWQSMSYVQIS